MQRVSHLSARAVTPAPAPRERGLAGAKVLVVDDCEINQMLAAACLEDAGATCASAANGAEAVEAVEGGGVDLVLMDCQMPVMDGYEATRRIRSRGDGIGARLPVVAMTAGTSPEERQRCFAAGMDAHLTKPLDDGELLRVLVELLRATPAVAAGDADGGAVDSRPMPDGTATAETSSADAAPYGSAWRRAVLDRCGGDAAFAARLLGSFVAQVDRDLARLGRALAAGDANLLREAAHALRGAAGHIAAHPLEAVAAELERLGGTGDVAGTDLAFARVAAEAARASHAAGEAQDHLKRSLRASS